MTVKTHLLDYFEETAARKAEAVAVRHNDQEISFGELMSRARKTGTFLLGRTGGVTNTPIAVFLPKEINTVIADLGIMYSSNPFMNLDVKTPRERIMNIFALVKPAAVITGKKFAKSPRAAILNCRACGARATSCRLRLTSRRNG